MKFGGLARSLSAAARITTLATVQETEITETRRPYVDGILIRWSLRAIPASRGVWSIPTLYKGLFTRTMFYELVSARALCWLRTGLCFCWTYPSRFDSGFVSFRFISWRFSVSVCIKKRTCTMFHISSFLCGTFLNAV